MPIFEYKCSCDKVFEVLQLPGLEKEVKCPECGDTRVTKLISAPFLPSSVGRPANAPAPCCASEQEAPAGCEAGCPGCALH